MPLINTHRMPDMNKYLVIQLARFGDILQTKRLILGLMAEPHGEVHLAVDQSLVSLAEMIYPGVHVHGLPVHGTRSPEADIVRKCRPLFTHWRQLDFTRVYNLNHSGCNHVLSGLFMPEQIAGYHWRQGQVLRGPWPQTAFRLTAHRLTNPLNLMDFWGLFHRPALEPERVNPPAKAKGGGLGVVMAGRHARRTLPLPILGRVLQAAAARHTGRIHLLGTAAERPAARRLRDHVPGNIQVRLNDLTGRTDWAALFDAVQGLDMLLTPDTGTMHLAAHLGTPVTAFFLSSAWCFETGPYGAGHRIWQGVQPCAPCLESDLCTRSTACAHPFADKSVLSRLSGVDKHPLPPGLCLLRTGLDDFGLKMRVLHGDLPDSEERVAKRELLRSHCLQVSPGNLPVELKAVSAMYHETDWMLEKP